MPYIDDPNLPAPDRRLEIAVQIGELAIRIAERLLAENAELKRCLAHFCGPRVGYEISETPAGRPTKGDT